MHSAGPPCEEGVPPYTPMVEVRSLQVPTLSVAADADMAPPSYYVEVHKILDGGLRDGGWMVRAPTCRA
jgi:hypothetical protein